jgi:transcriptional regulator with XRE-family HTH domain
VSLSKSSISRILSGAQEPKLLLAFSLAKALGVTLDYLVDDTQEVNASDQLVMVTEDEMTILKMVRRLGVEVSIDRLLNVPGQFPGGATSSAQGGRSKAGLSSDGGEGI